MSRCTESMFVQVCSTQRQEDKSQEFFVLSIHTHKYFTQDLLSLRQILSIHTHTQSYIYFYIVVNSGLPGFFYH